MIIIKKRIEHSKDSTSETQDALNCNNTYGTWKRSRYRGGRIAFL